MKQTETEQNAVSECVVVGGLSSVREVVKVVENVLLLFLSVSSTSDAEEDDDDDDEKEFHWRLRLEQFLPQWHHFLASLALAGLEGHLQHSIAQCVPVQTLNGHQRLVVVGHRHKAKALALVWLQVADHLHWLDGAEGAK